MSFTRFVELLNIKFKFQKLMHTSTCTEKEELLKVIRYIQNTLKTCDQYEEYIRKIAFTDKMLVG